MFQAVPFRFPSHVWHADLVFLTTATRPIHHAMKTYGGGGIAPLFLISQLDGGEWSVSRSGRFIAMEGVPGTHWVGPGAGLDNGEEKNLLALPGIETRQSSP
jgi:hypothetical protein